METHGQAGNLPDSPYLGGTFRYRFANVEFDESTNTLLVDGQKSAVERLPQALLSELLRRPNEVVTRGELFETVWQGRPTVDHVLANAVNKLRKALGDEAARLLINVPRVGYRLSGPVQRSAVGRQGMSALALKAGEPVHGREGFQLQRRLGDAPSGAVWLAANPKLKVPHVFKFAVDGDRLASLKREYTIYRVLRHELGDRTDFARVLDANFSNAPYFLECEYGGLDLALWATEHDRLAGMAQPERIALFLQIARAVAAAHAVGVLHKDLKPSNVLIADEGGHPCARLTDFGSSRMIEPGRLAELGVTAMGMTVTQGADDGILGSTPLYLAPELIAGQPHTTASDLYALGLILYQLLVGDFRRPMSTGWERDIADELLRLDLVAATEGRPDHRLGSVAEFIDRLATLQTRHAEHELRRHETNRAALAAALLQRAKARRPWIAAAFASLAVGLAASMWFHSKASAALNRAEQESARAQAINEFLNRDVLQSVDVVRAGAAKPILLIEVLRKASGQASSRFAGQPRAEAAVRYQMAKTYMRMASISDATHEFKILRDLLKSSFAPNDPFRLATQFTYVDLSLRNETAPELNEASTLLAETERDAGPALLGEESAFAFLAARARFDVLMRRGQTREALPVGLRLVSMADKVRALDATDRFEATQSLAELYVVLGQPDRARALLSGIANAPGAAERVGEVAYARAHMKLAAINLQAGRAGAAEASLRAVCERLLRTMGPNEFQLGIAEDQLARLYEIQGRPEKAEAELKVALIAFAAAVGDQHQYYKVTQMNMSAQMLKQGRSAAALEELNGLVPWFAKHSSDGYLPFDLLRAGALSNLQRPDQALAILAPWAAEHRWHDEGRRLLRWMFDAERAHAALAAGHVAEGVPSMKAAIAAGVRLGAQPWEVAIYEAMLDKVNSPKRRTTPSI